VNERCVDAAGGHWDVPESLSVDLSSRRRRKDGVQYRLGVHRSAQPVQAAAAAGGHPNNPRPHALTTVAQAGVQLAASVNVWKRAPREREPDEAATGSSGGGGGGAGTISKTDCSCFSFDL
jgi:hypothetical protein